MSYSIEKPKNWCMRLGNFGRPASLSILISCFLSLFLLTAELVQAAIVVSPSSVNATVTTVQTEPIIQTISIVDDGYQNFWWTASWNQDWMELDTLSGNATCSYFTQLTIRPEGLTEGRHDGEITIYTALGHQIVSVTLYIQSPSPSPTPGQVKVTPESVQVTVTPEQTEPIKWAIHLFDDNHANFGWTATWDQSWMELGTASGSGSPTYPLQLTIRPEGLTEGRHDGEITIYTALGHQIVSVTLYIQSPSPSPTPGQVKVTPESVQVTVTPEQTEPIKWAIHLFDDNHANFGWTATWDQSWMELGTASGSGSPTYPLQLTIRPEGLTEGTHNGSITIYTASGNLTVSVLLVIQSSSPPPGQVIVSPESVDVTVTTGQTDPIIQTISIVNSEYQNFWWTASLDQDWMALDLLGGTGSPTYAPQLTIRPEGLSEGSHNGSITIYTASGNLTVSVLLVIQSSSPPPGQVIVSPESVDVTVTTGQTDPIIQTISIVNSEYQNFWWTASLDQDWMALDLLGGTGSPTYAPQLTIRPEGLSEGSHNGSITIYTASGNLTVSVLLVIQSSSPPPGQVIVSPESVDVTVTTGQTDPIIQTISIVNSEYQNFWWTASLDQDWMALDLLGGTGSPTYAPQLTIRPEGLTEGTHNGSITIYTASGNLTVSVLLVIQSSSPPPGQVRVTPGSVQVTAITGQTDPITRAIHLFDDNHANFGWTATWDQSWMELDTPTGTGSSSYALLLTIRPEGLTEGAYNGNITIYTDSGDLTVSVTFDIQAQPPDPPPPPPPVKVVVSPGELQFYVAQEQLTNPAPITVQISGLAISTDDGCATATSSQEDVEFCWIASKSAQWITLNGNADSIVKNTNGNGSFAVGVDINQLLANQNIYGGNVTIYDGDVTVTLSDDAHTIPVRVYVNALREAAEKSVATTDWLDLVMNVPVTEDMSGALYVLAEHPSLAPGQVFAYRWDSENGMRFDLFSQWGHPVEGAESMFYAADIQNTPIAIPFSSDEGIGDPVIPYAPTDVAGTDQTPNIKAFIPITFGGGLRLIGMEGDWIVRAIVGDRSDIYNWSSWRELLYYVLHIRPVTGTWIVTEEFEGKSYTYIDDAGIIYPMILHEERTELRGVWNSPIGQTILWVDYANSNDEICDTLAIQGHRLDVSSCVQPGGYIVSFEELSIFGNIEYEYNITTLEPTAAGYLEGTWQYRFVGQADWSIPQSFSAIRQEVVIPLNPSCNCYLVNGTVNGYATGFIVDTGAAVVLLDLADARNMGLIDEETGLLNSRCDQTPELLGGVGGTIMAYKCYADIEIEGRLFRQNVEVYLSEGQPALLGVPFLEHFHISTNAEDGTMIIAP